MQAMRMIRRMGDDAVHHCRTDGAVCRPDSNRSTHLHGLSSLPPLSLLIQMGAYSSKPETDTMTEEGSNGVLTFGASAMRGWRLTQEVSPGHPVLLSLATSGH